MISKLSSFVFACLLSILSNPLMAQCASMAGNGTYGLTETCSISGVYTYPIDIAYINDSTFTITGLYLEPNFVVTAHVDCNTLNFRIDSTMAPLGMYWVDGTGTLSMQSVSLTYSAHMVSPPNNVDICTALFQVNATGAHLPKSNQLKINPNPSSGWITVRTWGISPTRVRIMDAGGRLVYENAVNGNDFQLDLHGLANGLLLIQVIGADGEIAMDRVVKQ